MEVTAVSVDVPTRAPEGATNAYVVGSDPALLVDPAGRSDRLDQVAAQRGVGHVAVTHHHPDHVGAVADYADRHDATVWARTGRADDFQAAAEVAPDRSLAHGTRIETGQGPVLVVDTPGHAPEHVGFAAEGDLLCGDLAVADGSVVVGAPEGDMRAYFASLRRVRATAPAALRPGHGPAIRGDDVRETVDRLLAHRLARERSVFAAVEGGARTVPEVCDAAYEKDVSDVRDLAEATVRAHLEKLTVEDRVRWDGERAEPAD